MSKKTRKKSPKKSPKAPPKPASRKPVSRKPARTQPAKLAKTQRARTRPAKASESAKNTAGSIAKTAAETAANAIGKASQKAPSKALRSTSPKAPARSKTAAVKIEAANPAAGKSGLAEGARAPAFHLPRDGGGMVSLSDYAGKNLVLFFYPRADTPGCTKEAIDFTRLSGAFAESGTALLGVSADPPRAQEAFRDKHELATPLASDEQHQMLEAYGVWGEKSMYGKTFLGIVRTTVLIGADGRILRIWRNVRVDGHADEVLAAVQAL